MEPTPVLEEMEADRSSILRVLHNQRLSVPVASAKGQQLKFEMHSGLDGFFGMNQPVESQAEFKKCKVDERVWKNAHLDAAAW